MKFRFLLNIWVFKVSSETKIPSCQRFVVFLFLFQRVERNLFADTRQSDFVFSRLWHFSALHLLKSIFLSTYWSDLSEFWKNTTTCSRPIMSQIFSSRKLFPLVIGLKNQFLDFSEDTANSFGSCFYGKLRNANVSAKIDGIPFRWAVCWDFFSIFSGRFLPKQKRKFMKQICDKPFAHCVFWIWYQFYVSSILHSVWFFLSGISKVVIDKGASFNSRKTFTDEF